MPSPGGFDALEQAFDGTKYHLDDETPTRLSKQLRPRRYPYSYRRSIPVSYADIPSSDDDSDSLRSDRSTRQPIATRTITPPHLSRENSGLPPTPPTITNSDIMGHPRPNDTSPTPQFADAVRNALQSQKSGLSTPGLHPLTPDPSPPASSEDFTAQIFLQPPPLSRYASSLRAESFHTAREHQSASQVHLPQTPSPKPQDAPPQTILDRNRDLRLRGIQLTVTSGSSTAPSRRRVYASSESDSSDSDEDDRHSAPRRSKQPHRSTLSHIAESPDPGAARHMGYAERDSVTSSPYLHLAENNDLTPEPSESDPPSVEDLNNSIYRHIQEENMKRHSTVSDSSALTTGVVIPTSEPQEKRLKRTFKCEALRLTTNDDTESHRKGANMALPLRSRKAQLSARSLEASPSDEPAVPASRRDVSDSRATDMASPESNRPSSLASPVTPQHTLRRSHKVDRLERNSSIRNTSADSHHTPAARSSAQDLSLIHI